MKNIQVWVCAIVVLMGITMSSCNKADDYTKFTHKELIGKWVYPQDNDNVVWGALDISETTAELLIQDGDWDNEDGTRNEEGLSYYKDGQLIDGSKAKWKSWGKYDYTFDEKEQCLYIDNAEVSSFLGTNKIATLKRTGKDEAMITSVLLNYVDEFTGTHGSKVYRVQ